MLFSKYTKGGRHVNDLISRKKERANALSFSCVPRGHAPDTWPELRPCWAPARGSQFMAFKMYSSQKYQSWTPETSCQGLFNQIHEKATKKVPEADFSS